MRYREIVERYTSDNSALLRYLRNDKPDPYPVWWIITKMIERSSDSDEMFDILSKAAGKDIHSADDLDEEEPELFHQLPADMQQNIYDEAVTYLMRHDPGNAPTTAYVSLQQKTLIKRNTWLVHFSDHASEIAKNGFKYGVDQMDRLGLTIYLGDQEKKYGGFNFAFKAHSSDARYNGARAGKYGRHAVLFQSAGVRSWHVGDEEEQIIFYGKDIDPREIIYLYHNDDYHNGDWQVMPKIKIKNRDYLFSGDYLDCVNWVIKNHDQYRKYLVGG